MPLEIRRYIFNYPTSWVVQVFHFSAGGADPMCRILAFISHQRTVWLEAVRHSSSGSSPTSILFPLSFPLEEMSQEALERVALFLFRFSSGLWNEIPCHYLLCVCGISEATIWVNIFHLCRCQSLALQNGNDGRPVYPQPYEAHTHAHHH